MSSTVPAAPPRSAAPTAPAAGSGFRPDVEGLRAVAILTVLWFHARLPGLDGGFAGVDIFFVISGFLITGQLVREVERSSRISLVAFYARRAKRLFPASATVLVVTALLTWLFLPRVDLRAFGGDIAAAAAYVINWRLAQRSVDYLAEDVGASPVQHFWSLAVEEQFYIVWPLLILLLTVLIRRGHVATRPGLAVGLGLITVPSLAWSIHLTDANAERAYFVTTTRLWELGIGALVAVGSTAWTRLRPNAGATIAWAGMALIGAGLLTQTTGTPWPGSAALVPTVGAALVILGGFTAGPRGPVLLLGRGFPVAVGALSYSLYLWHWPLVVVADELSGRSSWWALVAVVASVAPAWATHRFIENPVRFHPRVAGSARFALSLGLACSLLGVAAGGAVVLGARATSIPVADAGSARGGAGLGTGAPVIDPSPTAITPEPAAATEDVPQSDKDKCTSSMTSTDYLVCDYGDTTSGTTIAAIGDSKLAQWLPALEQVARERHWRIRLYTKSACAWNAALTDLRSRPNVACRTWGRKVLSAVLAGKPAAVLTSSLKEDAFAADGTQQVAPLVDGYVDYWTRLGRAGIPVVVIGDTPLPGQTVYECVLENPHDFMRACTFPFNPGRGSSALRAAVDRTPTSRYVDMNDLVCPGLSTCVPGHRTGPHLSPGITHHRDVCRLAPLPARLPDRRRPHIARGHPRLSRAGCGRPRSAAPAGLRWP